MPLSDDERRGLREALERMPDSVLEVTREHSERLLRDLQATNSRYPETQTFLKARGLTHVSQLDKAGIVDLTRHLRTVLRLETN